MPRLWTPCLTFVLLVAMSGAAQADMLFEAYLTGLTEVPSNASPATGFGTVSLNAAQDQITVSLSWSDLLAPATAGHIHHAVAGVNGPVIFPLTLDAVTTGAITPTVFAITPAQVASLTGGEFYLNVHSSVFPGGEIRGQLLQTPEPSSLVLLSLGVVGLCRITRRRRP